MVSHSTTPGGLSLAGVRAIYGIPDKCHRSAYDNMDDETRELARPKRIADVFRTPKPKYGYRVHEGSQLPTEECTCSVSHHCPHKPQGELDCRSLAPDPKKSRSTLNINSGYLHRIPLHQVLSNAFIANSLIPIYPLILTSSCKQSNTLGLLFKTFAVGPLKTLSFMGTLESGSLT